MMQVNWDDVAWERKHGNLTEEERAVAEVIVRRDLGEQHRVISRKCRFHDCVLVENIPADEVLRIVCIQEGQVTAAWY